MIQSRVRYHDVCLKWWSLRHDSRFFDRWWYSCFQLDPTSLPLTYQVWNVSLYDIQGILTGNHTMKMTLLDWGTGSTSMKFDYAYINETFMVSPTTTSSTPSMTPLASRTSSQTPSTGNSMASNRLGPISNPLKWTDVCFRRFSASVGGIVGAALGGSALLVGLVIGFLYCRRHKAAHQNVSSSELGSPTPASIHMHQPPFTPQRWEEIALLVRSAMLHDVLAAGNYLSGPDQTSQSIRSRQSSAVFQLHRRPPSQGEEVNIHACSSTSYVVDPSLPDPQIMSRYGLMVEQGEVIRQPVQRGNIPP